MRAFERADRVLMDFLPAPLSRSVFPPPHFTVAEEEERKHALTQTNIAQPALGAASAGLLHLLECFSVRGDMAAGHSYGEYVALYNAGVLDEDQLYLLSQARGQAIIDLAGEDLGTMAAVVDGRERTAELLQSIEGVWIANINAPQQTVISGTRQGIATAMELLQGAGIQTRPLSVACAFHTPVIAKARDRLAAILEANEFGVPRQPIFSNAAAAPYPADPASIRVFTRGSFGQPGAVC